MPETGLHPRTDADPLDSPDTTIDTGDSIDTNELLTMLSDEYARAILKTINEESLPAREIATRLDVSRQTVYRRLNRLEEIGAVVTSMSLDPDGHHRKQYMTTLNRVHLTFGGGTITVDAE